MLGNDVINFELRRLIKLTAQLSEQVLDLTTRLEAIELPVEAELKAESA